MFDPEKTPEKKEAKKHQSLAVELEKSSSNIVGPSKDSVVTLEGLSNLLNIDSRSQQQMLVTTAKLNHREKKV